jgi:hypothetical protein
LVDQVIQEDLNKIDKDTLTKILGVLRFVAKRRTTGKREYLTMIQQYVGVRVGKGIRLMKL